MGSLEGRVAIVTGAAGGLGREHALKLAREGAKVIANNRRGSSESLLEALVDEIRAEGGEAVADFEDVADFGGAERLVQHATDAFGALDVLVNNAGFMRDALITNTSEGEWDSVISIHLKGCFAPTRFAAAYWRTRSKAGEEVSASVINTSSLSAVTIVRGQAAYAAAKAGVLAMTRVAAEELGRSGVRVNAILPAARTRLTEAVPAVAEMMKAPEDPNEFDEWHPANTSPLVAYLASASCPLTGRAFFVKGSTVQVVEPPSVGEELTTQGRWTIDELEATLKPFA
jgi:NAD(P)-dependent dehydrogenase (short-subunit alcohol dehydrogenase family)